MRVQERDTWFDMYPGRAARQIPLCGATPARENWRQRGCAPSVRRLFCAVGAIAGISQTWDNEPSLIESIVDGRSPKTNIGMKPAHPLHSLLSGNQTDKTDLLCSAFLDTINGGGGCITGRQHRRHSLSAGQLRLARIGGSAAAPRR